MYHEPFEHKKNQGILIAPSMLHVVLFLSCSDASTKRLMRYNMKKISSNFIYNDTTFVCITRNFELCISLVTI